MYPSIFRPLMLRVKKFAREKGLDRTYLANQTTGRCDMKGVSAYGWTLLVVFYLYQQVSPHLQHDVRLSSAFHQPGPHTSSLMDRLFVDFRNFYYNFPWESHQVSFPGARGLGDKSGQPSCVMNASTDTGLIQIPAAKDDPSAGPLQLWDPFCRNGCSNLLSLFSSNFFQDWDAALRYWRWVMLYDASDFFWQNIVGNAMCDLGTV